MNTALPKIRVIINPISGTQSKQAMPEMLTNVLGEKYDVDIKTTEYAGHATLLANEATEQGYLGVVAVGGDGTVNEVASALRDTKTVLGIVPCGSGNGLARHLSIPLNATKAAEIILQAKIEDYDYCTVNDRPFFCTCGVGFDAEVSQKFAQLGKRGPFNYVKEALQQYIKFHPQEYTIEIDKKRLTERAFVIACGNAAQYGNNAFITPRASMQDGMIDVTIIHPFTPVDTPIISILLVTRHLDEDTNISTFRTNSLKIIRKAESIMHIDGEPIMMPAELNIACHKAGIRIFSSDKGEQNQSKLSNIDKAFWNIIDTIRNEFDF